MYVGNYAKVLFNKTSGVVFYNNKASSGGAMYINKNSYITFDGNSAVNFTENSATASGAVDILTVVLFLATLL